MDWGVRSCGWTAWMISKAQGRNPDQLTTLANIGKITVLRSDELIDRYTDLCQRLAHISRAVKERLIPRNPTDD